MASNPVKHGFERVPQCSLRKASGVIRNDGGFDKPFLGVCTSYIDLIPGHVHLHAFGRAVEKAAPEAGSVPFVFRTKTAFRCAR